MTAEILEPFARAMLAASVAILAVIALRAPIRRALGAGAAYALWLLAPAAALASFVPARRIVVAASPDTAPDAVVATVAEAAGSAPADIASGAPSSAATWIAGIVDILTPLMISAWALGCVVSLAIVLVGHQRLFGGLRLIPLRGEDGVFRARTAQIGPALVGVLRPRVVVPADFEQRFDAQERSLILAHERAHLAAGDAQINGLAALALCLGWFNPLFHVARRLLRVDQELACDERVMREHGRQRRAYAEAMLKTQTSRAIALGCAWPALGESSIRERLAMLARPQVSAARRALALPLCASLMLVACGAASVAQPPLVVEESADPVRDAEGPAMFDPALCRRLGVTCSGVETAVGDNPFADESSRLGMLLTLALQNGDVELARGYIEKGADVDFYIPGDGTPLVIAAQKRDYGSARLLLEAGADVNRAAPGDGAPLIAAAQHGDLAMAELLVAHGADVNGYVPYDETPLINAARNNHTSVARFLIEQGADVNLAIDERNWIGRERRRSPLSEAERNHHFEMIRLLRELGAQS